MDIQKELNEWADWFIPHDSKDLRDALELNSFNQLNVEKLLAINGLAEAYAFRAKDSWKAWQAAKAQAVPEGFVLVPKEPSAELVNHDKYMGFKIGQHICHVSLKKPRNIRQMMFTKKGELLLGTGTHTIGWLFAKDCVRTSQLPKIK